MRLKRFLIVKIAALGDIAVASVLLNRIRAEHPDSHITWLTGLSGESLVRLFRGVNEVLSLDEVALLRGNTWQRAAALTAIWSKLVGKRFDRVLLLHADSRYRVIVFPVLGASTSALEHGVNPLLTRFRGDEYARLLDTGGFRGPMVRRYEFADVRSSLPPRTTSDRKRIVIAPGGARNILRDDALRRWPIANYRSLADHLVAAGFDVTLIGDQTDAALRPNFAGSKATDLFGKLSLVELLATLHDADVLVTHDAGPLHFARLVRTPAVGIFGPTDPDHVVGNASDVVALWGGADLACRPCYDGLHYAKCSNNLCVKDVTVDAAARAVESLIERPSQSREPLPVGT
jgi:heptosyltransferase-2